MEQKYVRVNISIPKQLHDATKEYCKENIFNVSSLIAFLLTFEVFNEQRLKFKPTKNKKVPLTHIRPFEYISEVTKNK